MTDPIDVEITVSEGGTWLKLQVPAQTLLDWINTKYSKPRFEEYTSIFAVKFQHAERTLIRDFMLETWRFQ